MIWILVVILIIVLIVSLSRGGKKSKIETKKLKQELESMNNPKEEVRSNVADEISKLKKLLDEDVITKEEFDKQKEKLLGN